MTSATRFFVLIITLTLLLSGCAFHLGEWYDLTDDPKIQYRADEEEVAYMLDENTAVAEEWVTGTVRIERSALEIGDYSVTTWTTPEWIYIKIGPEGFVDMRDASNVIGPPRLIPIVLGPDTGSGTPTE